MFDAILTLIVLTLAGLLFGVAFKSYTKGDK